MASVLSTHTHTHTHTSTLASLFDWRASARLQPRKVDKCARLLANHDSSFLSIRRFRLAVVLIDSANKGRLNGEEEAVIPK